MKHFLLLISTLIGLSLIGIGLRSMHDHKIEYVPNPQSVYPFEYEYCLEDSTQVFPSGRHVETIRSRAYFNGTL